MTSARPICDLVTIVGGGTPTRTKAEFYGGGIPWVTPKDMKTWDITESQVMLTEDGVNQSPAKLIEPNAVLVVVRSGILKHTLPIAVNRVPVTLNQDMKALICKPGLHPDYLARYLKWRAPEILGWVRATTADNFPVAALRQLEIPVPALQEQRRIAAILDQADAVRTKRQLALDRVAQLGSALFRDVFGGSSAGRSEALGDVATFYAGGSLPVGDEFDDQVDGYLLMKVSDMNRPGNEIRVNQTALWSRMPGPRSATAPGGSVVLPKRGASIATNKKRLTVRPTVLDPNLMAVHPKPGRVMVEYLFAWFREFDLATITSGSSVPQLNKQDLAPLRVLVPSMAEQEQFARQTAAVESVRSTAQEQLSRTEELTRVLQDRAFKGEL